MRRDVASRTGAVPEADLADAVRGVARGLAAGLPLDDAIARAAEAVGGGLGALLEEGAQRLCGGARPEEACAAIEQLAGGPLVLAALAIGEELGGSQPAALTALADGLAERRALRQELAAATAQARMTARVVPAVPVAALGLLAVVSPGSVEPLIGTPLGLLLCAVSGGLAGIGGLLVRAVLRSALP